jgi:acetylornithine/N-succinyldiaminopimelate aminotransferase
VAKLCKDKGLLLIIDEVQTGMGRTGKLFAYEHYGIRPDIFTLAKGLAGGVPTGALCASEEVASAFEPGDHGSTFGGNPLACAAALAVLDTLYKENLIASAEHMGKYLKNRLEDMKLKHPVIEEIRGLGLMLGIRLKEDKAVELKKELFGRSVLVGSVGSSVIRLLPPLIMQKEDADMFLDTLNDCLSVMRQVQ